MVPRDGYYWRFAAYPADLPKQRAIPDLAVLSASLMYFRELVETSV